MSDGRTGEDAIRWRHGCLEICDLIELEMQPYLQGEVGMSMSDDEVYTVSDFVGIPREQMRRFLGVLKVMGAEIVSPDRASDRGTATPTERETPDE